MVLIPKRHGCEHEWVADVGSDLFICRSFAGSASGSRRQRHGDVSTFHVKDKVEARRGGSRHWARAVVKYVHQNGKYDIKYDDDGERERYVPVEFIRPRTKRSRGSKKTGSKKS